MNRIDLSKIDWIKIQKQHDDGLSWTKIPSQIGISMTILKRAEKEGFIKKIIHAFHHSDITKEKIGTNTKNYLTKNPEKHNWRKFNRSKSVPCENLKKYFKSEGINFVEEFRPLLKRSFRIDIAFPDIKLGIEVNGNQHYDKDSELLPYYKERKRLIEGLGWDIIEIKARNVSRDLFKEDLVLYLIKKYGNLDSDYSSYVKEKIKRRKRSDHFSNLAISNFEKIHSVRIKLINESNIDFSKFGWVKKVADLLGINYQKINSWMKKYMLDFYNEKCFKKTDIFIKDK